jgi:hypothetical protein
VIKVVVTHFPEKDLALEAVALDGQFEVEVMRVLPFGLRWREPLHPLEGVYDRDGFIDLLMDARNGEASDLLDALGLDRDAAWDRYHARRRERVA